MSNLDLHCFYCGKIAYTHIYRVTCEDCMKKLKKGERLKEYKDERK